MLKEITILKVNWLAALCRKGVWLMNDWDLSKSYDYKGREIRYGRLGEVPPMVLVHGTPWSSFNLRHLIQQLFGW